MQTRNHTEIQTLAIQFKQFGFNQGRMGSPGGRSQEPEHKLGSTNAMSRAIVVAHTRTVGFPRVCTGTNALSTPFERKGCRTLGSSKTSASRSSSCAARPILPP